MNHFKDFLKQNFSCIQCGECCNVWNLPVNTRLYEKLLKEPYIKTILEKEQTCFKTINNSIYLPKKDGTCVFFDPESKLCGIHKNIAEDFKPEECLRFPFAFARDKNGRLYVDYSFYCKAILQNQGNPVQDYLIEEFISKFDIFEFPDKIALYHGNTTDVKTINSVQAVVSFYLYSKCLNIPVKEWGFQLYSGYSILQKLIKRHRTEKELSITELFQEFLELQPDQKHNYKFNINLLNAIFLRKKKIFPDAFLIFKNKGTLKEPIIAENLDLSSMKSLDFSSDKHSNLLLLRYLLNILNRNILFVHKHSFEGIYVAMIITYCITLWYAKALAYVDDSETIEPFHTELAIRVTERYYIGHNARFIENVRNKYRLSLLKYLIY